MRALCGAIVTAGGLIGLGLAAVGFGIRFQAMGINPNSNQLFGVPSLLLILTVLVLSTLIGIGIAFLGLAYHHERRYYEQRQGTLPTSSGLPD